jgi:aspartokinase
MNSIFGVFDLARTVLVIATVSSVMIATGCTSAVDDTQRAWMNKVFRPYVPDVVQGNFISSEQYAKLQVGQSREQVRQILGTPLLASYFHANRWDYVFEFKRVSVVGVGMRSHVGVASKMFRTLSEEGINILMISTSEIKISVVIDEKYMELAVRALHKVFELDQK